MSKKKILITVKTYPNISTRYEELVCTAGFDEDGNWYRIYPVPYRRLPYGQQYSKYDWIELDLVKNTKDFRKESYRPKDIDVDEPIKKLGKITSAGNWAQRKAVVLDKARLYTNLDELIAEAKSDERISLAVFKPSVILDFTYKEEAEREWPQNKLALFNQQNLFEEASSRKTKIVKKLPYKFKYLFEDDSGKQSHLMIEDWEVGALYWKEWRKYGDEKEACESVKQKFFNELTKKDLYFFLGTTFINHMRAPNPFVIIGVFYPKIEPQLKLKFE
ncbi:MAG: hypothetical protein HUJ25_13360 [Crocinitomicaceae bacterium]|nr:hypothetical protein [Crocinitomicaceae bacterium]